MIFQHTWEKVLSGEKTQTRRIVKPGDGFTTPLSVGVVGRYRGHVITTIPNYAKPSPGFNNIYSVCNGKRTVYQVGKDYAVQPGRGKPAVARIEIVNIRREHVRRISREDAKAEGFVNQYDFFYTWVAMHDQTANKILLKTGGYAHLEYAPDERYQAWVLIFRLVDQPAPDAG